MGATRQHPAAGTVDREPGTAVSADGAAFSLRVWGWIPQAADVVGEPGPPPAPMPTAAALTS
jgi:hypothetical protein